ncbi:MAG: diguanylate cyclase [Azonexus sp.]|jgi:diguanylate cyclase (GGDEF)-like protein|uniref:diguanylate cyclase n=1 Tax=Azonexus sp. TaxID=1872668 RepID=UPI00282DF654|nr:diguanylate cyclase [Azonexus sp.]MDR0776169.1 diguanylate cyclase [Azonexus sp.]
MKILIVEDSRSNLLLLTQYVRHFGATVLPAENGAAAIATYARERPDLVLLDVVLPDIDGFEVARRIRGMESNGDWTPIIFLSSLGKDEDIEQGIVAGGDDYLHKPVSEVVLGAKVRAMERLIQMRGSLVKLASKLDHANQELQRLSASDGLTGIANRRYFDDHIAREWRRARRNSSSLALMMCDVDHFKKFNDTYGHQSGDECLRRVAGAIATSLDRGSDMAARYGGEEFVVVLSETSLGGALIVAEKIRHAVHALRIPHSASSHSRVTLSIGLAAAVPQRDDSCASLIAAADRALYEAKNNGRDRVFRAPPLAAN